MENLLENIITELQAEMPQLRTVDEDYGQLEMLDDNTRDTYPLTFPALLLELPGTEWNNVGGLSQKGTASLRARLIIDCYDDTHAGSGTTGKIREREAMRRKVHLMLQGRRIGEDSALIRTSSRFYTWNHGIKVYEQTYTISVTEIINEETINVPPPALKIKLASKL